MHASAGARRGPAGRAAAECRLPAEIQSSGSTEQEGRRRAHVANNGEPPRDRAKNRTAAGACETAKAYVGAARAHVGIEHGKPGAAKPRRGKRTDGTGAGQIARPARRGHVETYACAARSRSGTGTAQRERGRRMRPCRMLLCCAVLCWDRRCLVGATRSIESSRSYRAAPAGSLLFFLGLLGGGGAPPSPSALVGCFAGRKSEHCGRVGAARGLSLLLLPWLKLLHLTGGGATGRGTCGRGRPECRIRVHEGPAPPGRETKPDETSQPAPVLLPPPAALCPPTDREVVGGPGRRATSRVAPAWVRFRSQRL